MKKNWKLNIFPEKWNVVNNGITDVLIPMYHHEQLEPTKKKSKILLAKNTEISGNLENVRQMQQLL